MAPEPVSTAPGRPGGARVSGVPAEPLGDPERRPATEAEARALASALRLRILRQCLDQALTNKEIAERLARNPGSVLYHVRRLVETGFLAPDEERRGPRGSREVPYRATGKSWTLDVRDPKGTGSQAMLDAFLEEVRAGDPAETAFSRLGIRLTPDERTEFIARMQSLFDEYARRSPSPGAAPYSIFFAFHPDQR